MFLCIYYSMRTFFGLRRWHKLVLGRCTWTPAQTYAHRHYITTLPLQSLTKMTTLPLTKADSSTRLSWFLIAIDHSVTIFLWTPVLQGSPTQFPRLAIIHQDWLWQVKREGLLHTYTVATCILLNFPSCHTEFPSIHKKSVLMWSCWYIPK